jgi:hypothetical protein
LDKIKHLINKLSDHPYGIPILLGLHFALCVLVYFNTTMFSGVSESGALFKMLNRILAEERPMPISGFWYFTPAYIAYFFIKVFGSLHAYFLFQCILGTITTFIVYRIVLHLSSSRISGIISILLMTIYIEYILLSSVFYNQIYEIFFGATFILFNLLLFRERRILRIILFSLGIIILAYVSLLFRATFSFAFAYIFLVSIIFINKKDLTGFYKFFPVAITLFLLTFVFTPFENLRQGEANLQPAIFWGHTFYGGHGGKANFIYQKNEDLYNKRLKEYALRKNFDTITPSIVEDFQRYEVKRLITKEPHKWVFLQIKKFFYTFGSVPSLDALLMLSTGKIKLPWWVASAIVQLPMVLLILLFILTMDFNFKGLIKRRNEKILIYLIGAYLVSGICFYATYSERYRPIVFVIAIIPIIAINIRNLKTLFFKENRSNLYIRLSLIILFILIWIYQAYEAMVLDADRYFGALDKIK